MLTPTANDKPDQLIGDSGKPKEKVKAGSVPVRCAKSCHSRPKRPRPAVCFSATNKIGSICPALALRINSVLVESISGNTSTVKLGNMGAICSQIASAGHRMTAALCITFENLV
jgi:hypothetical protein